MSRIGWLLMFTNFQASYMLRTLKSRLTNLELSGIRKRLLRIESRGPLMLPKEILGS